MIAASERVTRCNDREVDTSGDYVLYWMNAARRMRYNFALDRAVEWSQELNKPILVLEALRVAYPWACERFHSFVLDGMHENAAESEKLGIRYYPYLEPTDGDGSGLLEALAERASLVITDDFPCFFLPRMVAAAAGRLKVLVEKVDSNGILPMRSTDRAFPSAHVFRRHLQKTLPEYLEETPRQRPSPAKDVGSARIAREVLSKWPMAGVALLEPGRDLSELPLEEEPGPVARGGRGEARRLLREFISQLERYADERNQPQVDVTSGLSPYLHFGHISSHEILDAVAGSEGWSLDDLAPEATGSRTGWWGMGESAEGFLDQVITWRELGYNACVNLPEYDQYGSLPSWARETLERHESDPREYVYDLEEFEESRTHDDLWNAAQEQLRREGTIHNYLRMLWGKKIIEWTATPRDALDVMIELNNKYALDGRNPNSYSGIFWVLGRYDRAWGPEREVFGKIRYMSSDNTARKVRVREYIEKYSTPQR